MTLSARDVLLCAHATYDKSNAYAIPGCDYNRWLDQAIQYNNRW